MTKREDDYSGYQEHPRFGRGPRITGFNPTDQPWSEGIQFHWNSGEGVRIQNTAIAANTDKQLPATYHVTHYFDSKRVCRKCGAYFIFFAEEQRYWYEELQFPLEANMVDCINCRKHEQRLRDARHTYEALLAKQDRSDEETLGMVGCGLMLVEESLFTPKVLPKFRGFLKTLEITHADSVQALKQRITKAESRES